MALSHWMLPHRPRAGNSDRNGLQHRKLLLILAILCCLLPAGCAPVTAAVTPAAAPPVSTADQEGGEPLGVVTYVEGDVTIEDALAARAPGPMRILVQQHTSSAMRPVRSGTTVYTGQDGKVTIVCVNGHIVRITSSGARTVTAQTCGGGASAPAKATKSVQPDSGSINTQGGRYAVGPETREKLADYGNIPIILSPRDTALLDLAPPIQWVAVPAASKYVLRLTHFEPLPEIVITPEEAACATDAALDDHAVCSLPWPTQWPLKRPSEPDEKYYLQVGARLGIAAPLRRSESSALEVLSATAAEGLQSDREAILGLDLDVVTEALLLGGISAAAGDYTTAIAAYRTALAVQPTPIVSVALGDLYRAVDLQRFAFAAYAEALQMLDEGGGDQAVRAAAEFGQGQVEFAFENYDHAAGHYEQAIALYREVDGADEALAAAQLALQTALDRQ